MFTNLNMFSALSALSLLAALLPASTAAAESQRVVSLDYCADQYVLQFVDRKRIAGLSPDADSRFSYLADRAAGLPQVRPVAEDVLLARPDLVVRSYGGGPSATGFFNQAGIKVLQVGQVNTLADVRDVTLTMQRLVALEKRTQNRSSKSKAPRTLYVTPTGYTTGPGTLMHEMLEAAGVENYQQQPGWRPLPLERLVYRAPDQFAQAFFDSHDNHQNLWSLSRHPVFTRLSANKPSVHIPGAWTACGGWFLLDAVEALAP